MDEIILGTQHIFLILIFLAPFLLLTNLVLKRVSADLLPWWGVLGLCLWAFISINLAYVGLLLPGVLFSVWAASLTTVILILWKDCCIKNWSIKFNKIFIFSHFLFALALLVLVLYPAAPYLGSLYPQTSCDTSLGHLTFLLPQFTSGEWINAWWVRNPWTPGFTQTIFSSLSIVSSKILGRGDLIGGVSQIFFLASLGIVTSYSLKKYNWLFLLSIISVQVIAFQMTYAYQDILAISFFVALVICFIEYINTGKAPFLGLAFFLSAASYCVKHQGGFYAVLAWMSLLIIARKSVYMTIKTFPKKQLVLWIVFSLLIFIPFVWKNIILAKSPFFPLGIYTENEYFWDKTSAHEFVAAMDFFKPKSFKEWFKAFFIISTDRTKFSDTREFVIGPFWWLTWGFIIIAFIKYHFLERLIDKNVLSEIRFLFLLSIFYFLGWLATGPVLRYLTPLVGVLIYYLWKEISTKRIFKSTRLLTLVSICFIIASLIPTIKSLKFGTIPTSKEEVISFIDTKIGSASAYQFLEKQTPEKSIVLSVHNSCTHLYSPRPIVGDWFGIAGLHLFAGKEFAEVAKFFTEMNFDYVLFNKNFDYWKPQEVFGDYLKCLHTTFDENGYIVYKVSKNSECIDAKTKELSVIDDFRNQSGFSLTPFWAQ